MTPNIILIVLDSLRTDHVGIYNNQLILTPHLDEFAKQSVYFLQAISQGTSTPPSMKAMMSSTYPSEYDGPTSRLSTLRPGFAAHLRQAGYTTGGIVTNEYLSAKRGWNRDFDYYDDCDPSIVYQRRPLFRGVNQIAKRIGFPLEWPITLPAESLFKRARTWLSQVRQPFFLWVHTMDIHWPYRLQNFTLNPGWQRRQHFERTVVRPRLISENPDFSSKERDLLLTQYRNAVGYTDEQVGAFISHLKKEKLLENTVVVIVSDHGEEFSEHGRYFHSANLYDVLARVPLIVHIPESLNPTNHAYPNQVRLIDIAPTFLELANIPVPKFMRGKSLISLLKGEIEGDRPAVTETYTGNKFSYRNEGWKFILNKADGRTELYQLTTDPDEIHDLTNEYAETAGKLQAELEIYIGDIYANRIQLEEDISESPEMLVRMRDLGYVD
jgi:arylsulfatase A-like enzyme